VPRCTLAPQAVVDRNTNLRDEATTANTCRRETPALLGSCVARRHFWARVCSSSAACCGCCPATVTVFGPRSDHRPHLLLPPVSFSHARVQHGCKCAGPSVCEASSASEVLFCCNGLHVCALLRAFRTQQGP